MFDLKNVCCDSVYFKPTHCSLTDTLTLFLMKWQQNYNVLMARRKNKSCSKYTIVVQSFFSMVSPVGSALAECRIYWLEDLLFFMAIFESRK